MNKFWKLIGYVCILFIIVYLWMERSTSNKIVNIERKKLFLMEHYYVDAAGYFKQSDDLLDHSDVHVFLSGDLMNSFLKGLERQQIKLPNNAGILVIDHANLEFGKGYPLVDLHARVEKPEWQLKVGVRLLTWLRFEHEPSQGFSLVLEIADLVPQATWRGYNLRKSRFVNGLLSLGEANLQKVSPRIPLPVTDQLPIHFDPNPEKIQIPVENGVIQGELVWPSLRWVGEWRMVKMLFGADGIHAFFRVHLHKQDDRPEIAEKSTANLSHLFEGSLKSKDVARKRQYVEFLRNQPLPAFFQKNSELKDVSVWISESVFRKVTELWSNESPDRKQFDFRNIGSQGLPYKINENTSNIVLKPDSFEMVFTEGRIDFNLKFSIKVDAYLKFNGNEKEYSVITNIFNHFPWAIEIEENENGWYDYAFNLLESVSLNVTNDSNSVDVNSFGILVNPGLKIRKTIPKIFEQYDVNKFGNVEKEYEIKLEIEKPRIDRKGMRFSTTLRIDLLK